MTARRRVRRVVALAIDTYSSLPDGRCAMVWASFVLDPIMDPNLNMGVA